MTAQEIARVYVDAIRRPQWREYARAYLAYKTGDRMVEPDARDAAYGVKRDRASAIVAAINGLLNS